MKKKIGIVMGLVFLLVVAGGISYGKGNAYTITKKNITLNLGETLDKNPETYVKAGWLLKDKVTIDSSKVDTTAVGTYELQLQIGKKQEKVQVQVVDSVPPEGKPKTELVFLEDKPIALKDLFQEISDNAGSYTLSAKDHVNGEELVYEDAGEYDNTIEIKDSSGNVSSYDFHFKVVAAPQFQGIKDITSLEKKEISYMDGVTAKDGLGNDITTEITVDAKDVDIQTPGIYKVTYKVTDSLGGMAEQTATVTIEKKPVPQENKTTGSNKPGTPSTSNKPSNPSTPSTSSKPSAPSAPSTSSKPSTPSVPNNSYRNEVLRIVNARRAENGLQPVSMKGNLNAAAQKRAEETVTTFSHTRPNGTTCFTVYKEYGVSYRTTGENIAAGQPSPESVMSAWMNSPGHRANILEGDFNHIGIGVYEVNGRYFWVQMFTD